MQSPDATSERYLVFQAVATLLERVAAPAGAVLVVEDAHWIDQPSLALLRYLAGRLEGTRLLVVVTYRDEDIDARTRDAFVDLRNDGGTRLSLTGLAVAEVHALVSALGGPAVSPTLRDRLAEVTGGHPLFLQEVLKHLVEENALHDGTQILVPEGVRQVISDWLWGIRIAWARAELPGARDTREDVERFAAEALALSAGNRPKYEAATLVTRARSRVKHGRPHDTRVDLERAIALGRASGDPALTLRAIVVRNELDGEDGLTAEIRELERRIAAERE